MIENLRLRDNVTFFVKYLLKRENRDDVEMFTDEELERWKTRLDKKGLEYTIETIENDSESLKFEGIKVDSFDEAVRRINGTYEEPIDRMDIIENAIIELAEIIGEGMPNG